MKLLGLGYNLRYVLLAVILTSIPVAILLFVFLMYAAGRRGEDDEIQPGYAERIPFDIYTFLCFCLGVCIISLAKEFSYADSWLIIIMGIWTCCLVGGLLLMKWLTSIAIRIKTNTLVRSCVCAISWPPFCGRELKRCTV